MEKKPFLGLSIALACLMILTPVANTFVVQTVRSSNQKIITEEINQKELLFQTIIDIANNKEIQKLLLISAEIRKGEFFNPDARFPVCTPYVLTKTKLNVAYHIGLMFLKTVSTSKIQSILERYQLGQKGIQKEIAVVIEKNATINSELTQLSNLRCGCENTTETLWTFPVLCTSLVPLLIIALSIYIVSGMQNFILLQIMMIIGSILNCFWA